MENIGKDAGRNTAKTQEIEVDIRKGGNTHKMEGSVSKQRGRRTTRASSKGRKRLERECRKEQQHMQDGHETRLDSNEGSS